MNIQSNKVLLIILALCIFLGARTAYAKPFLKPLSGGMVRDMAFIDPDSSTANDEQLLLLVQATSASISFADEQECYMVDDNCETHMVNEGRLYLVRIQLSNNRILEVIAASTEQIYSGSGEPPAEALRLDHQIKMIVQAESVYIFASSYKRGTVVRVFRLNDPDGNPTITQLKDDTYIGLDDPTQTDEDKTDKNMVMTSVDIDAIDDENSRLTLLIDWRDIEGDGRSETGSSEHTRLYEYAISHPGISYQNGDTYVFSRQHEKFTFMSARKVNKNSLPIDAPFELPIDNYPIPTRSTAVVRDQQGNVYSFQGTEQVHHGNYLIGNDRSPSSLSPNLQEGVTVYGQKLDAGNTDAKDSDFSDRVGKQLDGLRWAEIARGFAPLFCSINAPTYYKPTECDENLSQASLQFLNDDNDYYHYMRTLLKVPEAGEYTFEFKDVDDYVRLVVNGDITTALELKIDQSPDNQTYTLKKGFNEIYIEHFDTDSGNHRFGLTIYQGGSTSGAKVFDRFTVEPKNGNGIYEKGNGFIPSDYLAQGYGFFIPQFFNYGFRLQAGSLQDDFNYSNFKLNFDNALEINAISEAFRGDDYFRANLDIEPENAARTLLIKRDSQLDANESDIKAFANEMPEKALFANGRIYLASRYIKEKTSDTQGAQNLKVLGKGIKISALQTNGLSKVKRDAGDSDSPPLEARVILPDSQHYYGKVLSFAHDSENNLYVIATLGHNDGSEQSVDATFYHGDGTAFLENKPSGGASFFIGKLDANLNWQWVTFPQDISSTLLAEAQDSRNVPYLDMPITFSSDENVMYIGGFIRDGEVTIKNQGELAVSSNVVASGQTSGFVSAIETESGSWFDLESLVIESEFGEGLVVPAIGSQQVANGETVSVSAPTLFYIDADGNILRDDSGQLLDSNLDGSDTRAVTRYRCTSIEVNNIRIATDSCATDILFEQRTTVRFNWQVEHLITIISDFQNKDIRQPTPNPDLATDIRHWLIAGETTTLSVDGVVRLSTAPGQRELLYQVDLDGPGQLPQVTLTPSEQRQQPLSFVVSDPLYITYKWKTQFTANINVNNSTYEDAPKLLVVSTSRENVETTQLIEDGTGVYWIDLGSELNLLVPSTKALGDLDGYANGAGLPAGYGSSGNLSDLALGCLLNTEFIAIDGSSGHSCNGQQQYYNLSINTVDQSIGLQWLFDVLTLETSLALGESVSLEEVINQNIDDVPSDLLPTLRANGRLFANAVAGSVLSGPDDSTVQNMVRWAAYEQRFYPLRPGKISLEFEVADFSDPLEREVFRVEIMSAWPDSFDYSFIIDTPAIELDRRNDDFWAFAELAYSEINAESPIADGGFFPYANNHNNSLNDNEAGKRSLLLFTCTQKNLASDETVSIAIGDTTTEPVCPRTVLLRKINSVSVVNSNDNPQPLIGDVLTEPTLHNAPHSGYIVNELARYNPYIYAREALSGPIIPVNQEFTGEKAHEFVVLWYKNKSAEQIIETGVEEPIYWPNKAVSYRPRWPDKDTGNRIVVASRLGSEGTDFSTNSAGQHVNLQAKFLPEQYASLRIYHQENPQLAGYNPNEEHAFVEDAFNVTTPQLKAAFALRNDLNITSKNPNYTSDPYVLVEYRHIPQDDEEPVEDDWRMLVYQVVIADENSFHLTSEGIPTSQNYTFTYPMLAGEPVVAPYPINLLQGIQIPTQNWGHQGQTPAQNVFWQDITGKAYAVSGDAELYSYQWYPMRSDFWWPQNRLLCYSQALPTDFKPRQFTLQNADSGDAHCHMVDVGSMLPLGHINNNKRQEIEITYQTSWPINLPLLKAGETLTFSGGEAKEDNPSNSGLPGVLAFKTGELIFDSSNPLYGIQLNSGQQPADVRQSYSARVAQVLERRTASWPDDSPDLGQWLATGKVRLERGKYYFNELPASLQPRVYLDSLTLDLEVIGFLNGKTLGDSTLTAAPGAIYVLQPNILSSTDLTHLQALCDDGSCGDYKSKVNSAFKSLYEKSRVPHDTCSDAITQPLGSSNTPPSYTVGLCEKQGNTAVFKHSVAFGPGLAVVPNDELLAPDVDLSKSIYITVAENNHELAGGSPISLRIIQITPEQKFRGEIAVLPPDNVFDEKVNLRHSADFGANGEDMVFEWYYRPDDGDFNNSEGDLPFGNGIDENGWLLFTTDNNGLGQNEINLSGNSSALLADNLFLSRYRHTACDPDVNNACWSQWAGAADNKPSADLYRPQLVQGWVKRVIDRVNAFEARINNFYSSESPATYSSMIQQAGQPYNGPVALNNDQNIIENTGLIQLYETVLERALRLSINASQPYADDAVYKALQLVSSRLAQLYTLLGNEAYVDALDPTIGFTTASSEYGSLAPSVYSFENQMPSLIEEELALLRGRDRAGASPAYNRLLWNFTLGDGEVAYAQNYNISDVDESGFIDVVDARTLYPQGHGDAWGHYTKALHYFYQLAQNENFVWVAAAEKVSVDGLAIEVDFEDERRFAEIAAAKAQTGHDIINLTFRQHYVEDPYGQWQGYKDRNTDRAWGLNGWAQRVTTGAYFDWLLANAILPSKTDNNSDESFEISRQTVPDVEQIASQAEAVYALVDAADAGKNPLGILPDAVPFDIDPVLIDRNSELAATHFEQVSARAQQALDNAFKVFDYANDNKNRIREVADSAEDLFEQAIDQDLDFRNRLIEIFGTPHPGNIGSGKAYPAGYNGPDLYFYLYVDTTDIVNENEGDGYQGDVDGETFNTEFTAFLNRPAPGVGDTELSAGRLTEFQALLDAVAGEEPLTLSFPQDASDYGFVAPSDWGERRTTGKIQHALTELVKAEADLTLAIIDYNGMIFELDNAITEIEAFNALNAELTIINEDNKNTVATINGFKAAFQTTAALTSASIDYLRDIRDATIEGFPKVVGVAQDVSGPARQGIFIAYAGVTGGLAQLGVAAELGVAALEAEEEVNELRYEIEISNTEGDFELQQMLREAEYILDDEEPLRISMYRARETMRQASEAYRNAVSEGLRVLEEREVFNKRLAVKAQEERYKDMTFRIGQYEALQKYHSAFDLAARYIYLAARVYDYETNLAETDPRSAQRTMANVVKERLLGEQGVEGAVSGVGGLSELLSTLKINFATLKSQMGFNNPQTETGRFSLRYELARIAKNPDSAEDDQDWRNWLDEHRVEDLWQIPEYRRFARNFAPESAGPQTGLVIPFESTIQFGRNFFNRELSGGDHAYDATNFATKIRSVGVWFENYNNAALAETPRVYLIPAGTDYMYVPTSRDLDVREWQVIDQRIPVPLPVTSSSLNNQDFIPVEDTLVGDFGETRRISSFRAYHDGGQFNDAETHTDSRLIGRSVWNSRWLLIIPGQTFLADPQDGLETFIHGKTIPSTEPNSVAQRDGNGISDIRLFFQTYSYSGN